MFKNTTESMGLKEKDYTLYFVLRNHQELKEPPKDYGTQEQ